MKPDRVSIGLAVRASREAAGLTAQALADRLGLTPSTLSRTETGLRALEFEEALALVDALNIDLSAFLALVDAFQSQKIGEKTRGLKAELEALKVKAIEAHIEASKAAGVTHNDEHQETSPRRSR